jgi:hypothetical protein
MENAARSGGNVAATLNGTVTKTFLFLSSFTVKTIMLLKLTLLLAALQCAFARINLGTPA